MYLLLLILLCSFSLPAYALDIPLTVAEPSSVARTAEVVTSGVPLPVGTQTSTWKLLDSGGSEVPVSINVLAGRTPWLLLQFQSTHTSGQTKTYTLRDSAAAATLATPVVTTDTGTTWEITTGKIKAVISKTTNYKGLTQVIYDADSNGTYADPAEVIVSAPTTFSTIRNEQDDLDYTADGNVTAMAFEYDNDHRAVLRVDGEYKNGSTVWLLWTTRYTFTAGSSQIKVEHILRNNLQNNQRDVKLSSATLVLGGGSASVTAASAVAQTYINVGTSGATFQIVPATFYTINTSTNGGFVLGDLSNLRTTVTLDFQTGLSGGDVTARTTASKNPLMALATPRWYSDYGELSTTRFSTLQDEKDAYDTWGWTWTGGQVPCSAQGADWVVRWVDVHDSTEADDLWQNLLMFVRGGCRDYFNRTRAWAWYMMDNYAMRSAGFAYAWDSGAEGPSPVTRSALPLTTTSADNTYINGSIRTGKLDIKVNGTGDHLYGWGLIDWYYFTGDVEALEAAVDVGEVAERMWLFRTNGYNLMFSGTRRPGRGFWMATRLYEAFKGTASESRWNTLMTKLSDLTLNDTASWTTWNSGVSGFYSAGKNSVDSIVGQSSPSAHDTLGTRLFTTNEHVLLAHASWRYWRIVGDTTAGLQHKDRLIKLARFYQNHVLHASVNYANSTYAVNFPSVGQVWQKYYDQTPFQYLNIVQANAADVLVLGAQLTGDTTMLTLARGLWSRTTKTSGTGAGSYPPPAVPADPSAVQHFTNDTLEGTGPERFLGNCCLHYIHRLFSAVVDQQAASTSWTQYAGSLNIDPQGWGFAPSIAVDTNGDVYVASAQHRKPDTWEPTSPNGLYVSKISVSKISAGVASTLGSPLGFLTTDTPSNGVPGAWQPSVAAIGTTPYVAWYERMGLGGWGPIGSGQYKESVFVRQWNGSTWVALAGGKTNGGLVRSGGADNTITLFIKIKNIGGTLYAAWIENSATSGGYNTVVVAHWNGSAWVQDGVPLSVTTNAESRIPDHAIFDVNGTPHVAWSEWRRVVSAPLTNNTGSVVVYKLNAGTWEQVGTALNSASTYVNQLDGVGIGTTPYVCWQEKVAAGNYVIRCKHWNGSSWTADGGVLNVTATGRPDRPALTTDGTDLWLAWSEREIGQKAGAYARKLTVATSTWSNAEGPINLDTATGAAKDVALAIYNGTPQITWSEKHFPSHTSQIYVFARDANGTGSPPFLTAFGSPGTTPNPQIGAWQTISTGGIVTGTSGANGVWAELFANWDWIPSAGMAVTYEKYHTMPGGSSGESKQALLGYEYLSSSWRLVEPGAGSWTPHFPGNGHPQGISAVTNDGLLLIRGGLNGSQNWHTYLYDFAAGAGERVIPPSEIPHTAETKCANDTTRNQIMCIGHSNATAYVFDRATLTWSAKATSSPPTGRKFPGFVYDSCNDKFIMFAGQIGSTNNNEMWEYDPAGDSWTQYNPSGVPSARYSPQMSFDSVACKALIVGGTTTAAPSTSLVDAYLYDAATHTISTYASPPAGIAGVGFRGNTLVYAPEHNVHMVLGSTNLSPVYITRVQEASAPAPGGAKREGGGIFSGGGLWR